MIRFYLALITFCLLLPAGAAYGWQQLEDGLWLGEFHAPTPSTRGDSIISILKIDPTAFSFHILMASQHGDPRTLDNWADDFGLVAGINASMYLPNNRTSTGLMRCGGHLNNGTINKRFGAFFMAGPRRGGLPMAQIVDRKFQDWRVLLEEYGCVVQNYRMISLAGKNLWKQDDHIFSTASVAMDEDGNILFIHCRSPYSVHDLGENLLALPLKIRSAMYVEGGREAGLYVRSKLMTKAWSGGYASLFFGSGTPKLHPLPNVIGIKRKITP